jgi:phosphoglycolate phosphatase-like HAD superfamily hydrolase
MSTEIKTIFCDIDGCLVKHTGNMTQQMENTPELLPGVKDKLVEWERAGYKIILTTGRRESLRDVTERMLTSLGIFWDVLIMGLPRGARIVINDIKPGTTEPMALAWSPERNKGFEECPY